MGKMSIIEWIIIIAILFIFDVLQFILEWATFGAYDAINMFLDWIIGALFAGYLWLRGETIGAKRGFSIIGTIIGEMIPGVEGLPFWTADGIYNMAISLGEKRMEKKAAEKNIPPQIIQKVATSEKTTKNIFRK